jgi:hypothetical protein
MKPPTTQAERFANFMADSAAHGPPIARGTARRALDEHAVEITAGVVRFRDRSEIQRADGSLVEPVKKSRGARR